MTAADAAHGIALNPDLVAADGFWSFPYEPAPAQGVDLIQGYDEYVMSYGDTKHLMAGGREPRHLHTILVDGKAIGSWRHTAKARSVELATDLNRPLGDTEQAALEAAVARFGTFMTRQAVLR